MKESPVHFTQNGFFTGVAAIMANVIEQVLHPFEVVKLRFQSKTISLWQSLRLIRSRWPGKAKSSSEVQEYRTGFDRNRQD